MEVVHSVILGIIQGLTEFLPVSSSGHLVVFQHLFGIQKPLLFFDISVHIGTLAAVIIIFWQDISTLFRSLFDFLLKAVNKKAFLADINNDNNLKLILLIITGSLPTAIIGLLFHKVADRLFSSVFIVGVMLLVTGVILWISRNIEKNNDGIDNFSINKALIIGIVQGLAVMPGISRSGSTIVVGLLLGLNRELSAKYSFLLSIPAVIGAEIISLKGLSQQTLCPDITIIAGVIASFITGYCALKVLMIIVKKGRLYVFSPYCWFAGITAIYLGM